MSGVALQTSPQRSRHRLVRGSNWLLLAGLLALAYCGLIWAAAQVYQSYQRWRLHSSVTSLAVSPKSLIGEIEIPRIGLSVIVREGDDAGTLRMAVGHIPGTALPGEPGNVGIAGHRDTFFRSLRNVHAGDLIMLRTPRASFRYQVASVRVVGPNHTEVLEASGQPLLTLVTCHPFSFVGSAPNRYIVRAQQIAVQPR